MATFLNVDSICTDQDLADELGGTKLSAAMPVVTDRDKERANGLIDVLDSLRMRSPPVRDTNLSDPAELKKAVMYRALHKICRAARHSADDSWDMLAKDYAKDFGIAMSGSFTVSGGFESPAGLTFSIERR